MSILRIQFNADKLNQHASRCQPILKYDVFWTPLIVPFSLFHFCIVFKVGKITVMGDVCFTVILSVKLYFTDSYVHLALVLEKTILEVSFAELLPLLSHIVFSWK